MTMASIGAVEPVKLFCGMIGTDQQTLDSAASALAAVHGPIDLAGADLPFTHTDYYEAEMGRDLLRRFVAFRDLIDPCDLATIKQGTQDIEAEFAVPDQSGSRRRVNLDPGYVAPAKLVLASTKDFAHRVALGKGIYAEVTLNFCRSGIRCFPWTYPDFREKLHHPFLHDVRQSLLEVKRIAGRSDHWLDKKTPR